MTKQIKHSLSAIMLVASLLFFGCAGKENQNSNTTATKTTYNKVLESKTIRVGYISYPPSFVKDPNTKNLSGIFYDVLMEAGRNMEIKIDFVEEVGWGTMVEAIQSGKVDLVCTGIWPNSTRGKFVDFTNAIYYSPIKAYVRAGNTKFDGNLKTINSKDVKIAAIDGEMTSIIAQFDFPDAQTAKMPQNTDVSQVLLDVASNKADVTFVEPAIANEYLAKNPGSIKEVAGVEPLRVFPNVMMIPKGDVKFQSMLNIAIEELANNGFVDKIINKYEKYPNSFYRRQSPYHIQ
jgi:polar amino acid transport system substrate-binding protein